MPLRGLVGKSTNDDDTRTCCRIVTVLAWSQYIGKRLTHATTRYVLKDQQHLLNKLYRTNNYPIDFEKNVILSYREKSWHMQAYGNICSTIPCLLNDPHLFMGAI